MKQGRWLKIALVNLIVVAFLGASLRFAFIREIPGFDFRKVLHAHSHVALSGWVFAALFSLFLVFFLSEQKPVNKGYVHLFWLNQAAVAGMLVSFPIQGYGGWAVFFSTLQTLVVYLFAFRFLKDLRRNPGLRAFSTRLAKTAIWWMLLSTAGLLAMAPIAVFDLKGSAFYYMSVQFYLHFQFNGWFIFGILSLFFKALENIGIEVQQRLAHRFYLFLVLSCFLTFALAVTWSNPVPVLFWINSAGVIVQLIALYFFWLILRKNRSAIKNGFKGSGAFLLVLSLLAFGLKILIQAAVVIPDIATIAYTIRNYVIGFLHLILLGLTTLFLLGFSILYGGLSLQTAPQRWGIGVFVAGFLSSEFLLFLQGTFFWAKLGFLPNYYESLFAVSVLMPLGLFVFLIGQKKELAG